MRSARRIPLRLVRVVVVLVVMLLLLLLLVPARHAVVFKPALRPSEPETAEERAPEIETRSEEQQGDEEDEDEDEEAEKEDGPGKPGEGKGFGVAAGQSLFLFVAFGQCQFVYLEEAFGACDWGVRR